MAAIQKIHFTKHWSDIATQLSVLESRGLRIADKASAADFLSYINYYRFTGYCLRFQQTPNVSGTREFVPGDAWRKEFFATIGSLEQRFPTFLPLTGFPKGWRLLPEWQ